MPAKLIAMLFLVGVSGPAAGQALGPVAVPPISQPDSAPEGFHNPHNDELVALMEQLIRQLGDEKFEVREAASRSLAGIGNRARAPLERATKSVEAEIAFRAKAILDRLPKLTHTIVDALRQPIPLAEVTVQFSKKQRPDGGMPSGDELPPLMSAISEEDGRIAIPELVAGEISISVVVQHSSYGAARFELSTAPGTTVLQLPLVRRGTEAYQRAVSGQLVSADGRPVVGAVIHGSEVRTPGEGLVEGAFPRGEALSDKDGRFAYYLPPSASRSRERGALIPANSRYSLRFTVPDDESFFPWSGRYSNVEPVRIELPRAARFHRFRFEALGGGWISDLKQLQQVRVQFDRMQDGERMPIDLGAAVAISGRKLLAGKYVAERIANGKMVEYLPIIVTDDSPEQLNFDLPHAVTYSGRVVNGVTGKPVAGAIVIGWNSTSRNNLALLTAEDWKLLQDVSSNPPADHPAIKRLNEFYGVQGLVRTDIEGRFEIIRQPDQQYYGLLAFAENSVPFKVRVGALKPDERHQVDAGDFLLFSAARILVRPVFSGDHLAVAPRWLPAEAGQAEWFDRFQAIGRSSDREFEYVHWLALNQLQPVFVPASVRLHVRFETPYDDQWDAAVVEDVHLEPGASQEVGDLRFAANLPVSVRVVNREGKPVEGVPVRQKHLVDNAWSIAHNTDGDGLAHFHAPHNTEGEFWVSDLPGPREVRFAENLLIKYKVGGEPPLKPFTIKITDSQTELLLRTIKTR